MIIYIPLEISVRELQGHLLLSLVAVSQGHQILIASANDLWLYKRFNLLSKGVYLIKNINVPTESKNIYDAFIKDGFEIYCIEQEPSILWSDFEKYLLDRNISEKQNFPFKGVFCWGERDMNGYRKLFKTKKEVFVNTGSPRSDLWHTRFASMRTDIGEKTNKPYILIVSNFSMSMGTRHWTEYLNDFKKNECFQSDIQESNFIDFINEDTVIAIYIIKAVRYLAAKYKNFTIMIRPHPMDDIKKWENIIGEHKNIIVTSNQTPLSNLISSASIVIQNGCTSALETVLQKVPLINYGPMRHQGDLLIPSLLGLKAENIEDLESAIEFCLNKQKYAFIQEKSEIILQPIITSNGLSANKIINIIQDRSQSINNYKITKFDLINMRMFRITKNCLDIFRKYIMLADLNLSTYRLDKSSIINEVYNMANIIKINPPKLSFIAKTGILISKN